MRKIVRTRPSDFWRTATTLQAKETLFQYLRRPIGERQQQRVPINDDLFRSSELIGALQKQFRGKCAYCETTVAHDPFVDHFRPLRFGGEEGSPNGQIYYSWLAFEWRNIFLSCGFCVKSKGHRFPVFGKRAAFLAAFDDARVQEDPMLIDPTIDDPGRHLHFSASGQVVGKTMLGGATIDLLVLNRSELVSARAAAIQGMLDSLSDKSPSLVSSPEFQIHHYGAVAQVLARIARGWKSGARWLSYHDERFVERFLEEAAEAQGSAKRALLRQIENSRDLEGDPSSWFDTSDVSPRAILPQRQPLPPLADNELKHIAISGFKSIDRLELAMQSGRDSKGGAPCLMILGENSTGKSTILSAIALTLAGIDQAMKLVPRWPALVRSDRTDHWDQLDSRAVEVEIDFHYSDARALLNFDPLRETVTGSMEPSTIVLAYGPRRYFDRKRRTRGKGAAQRIKTLFDPLATIPYPADWLAQLEGQQFLEVAKALRLVLALNDEDQFVSEPERGLCVNANGKITPVEWLSDGYRSVFAMTVDIMRELLDHYPSLEMARAVVLIDEIETHLHPRWKMQVMRSLRRAFPRVQFIATTHDPLCLRGMDDGEIAVLQRTADEQIVQLAELPSIKGMTAEQILTSDLFGLASTADPDVEHALASLDQAAGPGALQPVIAAQTQAMIERLVIGGSPADEVLQSALKTFLDQREPAVGALRSDIRKEAISTVLQALADRPEGAA